MDPNQSENPDQIPQTQEEVSYTPPRAWGQDETVAPVGDLTTPSPTFSETLPPTVSPATVPTTPIDPSPRGSSSFSRTILNGVVLILLGILLGVLASFFLPVFSLPFQNTPIVPNPTPTPVIASESTAIQVTPTVEITPIPAPTATPSALLDLKWNMMTVKSPLTAFSDYKIYYPTTWTIKEYKNTPLANESGSSSLILSKGKTTLSIVQQNGRGVACLYTGDPDEEGAIRFNDFNGIAKNGVFWRTASSLAIELSYQYQICEQDENNNYWTTTKIGELSGMNLDDPQTVEEFNYILEKIAIL